MFKESKTETSNEIYSIRSFTYSFVLWVIFRKKKKKEEIPNS